MASGLLYDGRFLQHRAPYDHPENPGRLEAIWEGLGRAGLIAPFERVPARAATDEELLAVHTQALLETVASTAGRELTQLDPDTYAGPESAAAARLAAGGLIDLVLEVWKGRLANGLALVRPPGHHAEADRAMGFCLFNNVAVAARAALRAGAERVLIVDWDVHHGNGTQNTFWNEPRVLYFSIHEFPFYPGTGGIHETGGPDAPGRNVNVPWPGGMGDAEYVAAFDRVLMPVAAEFAPDLVIVSCGFDAARGDLLGGMDLSEEGYVTMTDRVTRLAGGRVVLTLEGGYERRAIARAAAGCAGVLLGERSPEEHRRKPEPLGTRILDEVVRVQRAFWPGL